jgi:branched-chain amino acid transport system substrate-binding protein
MKLLLAAVLASALVGVGCAPGEQPIVIAAVYPLSGAQGPGGVDEFRGAGLAVDLMNQDGGVGGRPVELDALDVSDQDAVPAAMQHLEDQGTKLVLGSYGSTISAPAAAIAKAHGMLFWETGAVGDMNENGSWTVSPPRVQEPSDGYFFRVAPTGSSLGSAAISFMAHRYAPLVGLDGKKLRYAVVNVGDIYGRSVAHGAVNEIRSLGLPFAGRFEYDLKAPHFDSIIRSLKRARPDILFVSAYIDDGVAFRRKIVSSHLHLVGNIGSSSSYCMPAFGESLGKDAVGVFASDKPDAEYMSPDALSSSARSLLDRARAAYTDRYHEEMSAAALAGFSGAWALLDYVLPGADPGSPASVAAAARRVNEPLGSLPNGSGLEFAGAASRRVGENLKASSVIWEWVGVGRRAVVWPRRFATRHAEVLAARG